MKLKMFENVSKSRRQMLYDLLTGYKREIKRYNFAHLKEAIAISVLLDLSLGTSPKAFPKYIEKGDITLNNLIYGAVLERNDKEKNDFIIPTKEDLEKLQNHYRKIVYETDPKQMLKTDINQNAAITWIILMINSNMVKEGDSINLSNYDLYDYINDEELKKLFNINDISIRKYILKNKKEKD